MGRVCYGPSLCRPTLLWAEFAMGRDVQLPFSNMPIYTLHMVRKIYNNLGRTHGAPYRGYGYVPLRFGGGAGGRC